MENLQSEDKELGKKRLQFKYEDRVIYEWNQTIDEVFIYIKPPPFVLPENKEAVRAQLQPGQTMPEMDIKITSTHISVGIKGNPPFLNEDLGGKVNAEESLWYFEDEEIHISLQKIYKAQTWTSACKGHSTLDPMTEAAVKKNILLERFQEENPGFDFSGADLNGMVPDPDKFMGGVSYK